MVIVELGVKSKPLTVTVELVGPVKEDKLIDAKAISTDNAHELLTHRLFCE